MIIVSEVCIEIRTKIVQTCWVSLWPNRLQYAADLTVSKRPGTSYQIEIHFAVINHSYILFSFMKLVKTL